MHTVRQKGAEEKKRISVTFATDLPHHADQAQWSEWPTSLTPHQFSNAATNVGVSHEVSNASCADSNPPSLQVSTSQFDTPQGILTSVVTMNVLDIPALLDDNIRNAEILLNKEAFIVMHTVRQKGEDEKKRISLTYSTDVAMFMNNIIDRITEAAQQAYNQAVNTQENSYPLSTNGAPSSKWPFTLSNPHHPSTNLATNGGFHTATLKAPSFDSKVFQVFPLEVDAQQMEILLKNPSLIHALSMAGSPSAAPTEPTDTFASGYVEEVDHGNAEEPLFVKPEMLDDVSRPLELLRKNTAFGQRPADFSNGLQILTALRIDVYSEFQTESHNNDITIVARNKCELLILGRDRSVDPQLHHLPATSGNEQVYGNSARALSVANYDTSNTGNNVALQPAGNLEAKQEVMEKSPEMPVKQRLVMKIPRAKLATSALREIAAQQAVSRPRETRAFGDEADQSTGYNDQIDENQPLDVKQEPFDQVPGHVQPAKSSSFISSWQTVDVSNFDAKALRLLTKQFNIRAPVAKGEIGLLPGPSHNDLDLFPARIERVFANEVRVAYKRGSKNFNKKDIYVFPQQFVKYWFRKYD